MIATVCSPLLGSHQSADFPRRYVACPEGSQTTDWRWHDLRRTAASGMARLSVAPHVVEKVLNHVSGIISGVAAVYNRHGYDNEKRDALEQWGSALAKLAAQN